MSSNLQWAIKRCKRSAQRWHRANPARAVVRHGCVIAPRYWNCAVGTSGALSHARTVATEGTASSHDVGIQRPVRPSEKMQCERFPPVGFDSVQLSQGSLSSLPRTLSIAVSCGRAAGTLSGAGRYSTYEYSTYSVHTRTYLTLITASGKPGAVTRSPSSSAATSSLELLTVPS